VLKYFKSEWTVSYLESQCLPFLSVCLQEFQNLHHFLNVKRMLQNLYSKYLQNKIHHMIYVEELYTTFTTVYIYIYTQKTHFLLIEMGCNGVWV